MINKDNRATCGVDVSSEYGRLRAVLLHRPGLEIERMTPQTTADALYSDILNKRIVDTEYNNFCGVFEKWADVYYVEDLLATILEDDKIKEYLVRESCKLDKCPDLADALLSQAPSQLAKSLIQGVEDIHWDGLSFDRYRLKPLYNLFFTRDASSTVYDKVLINTMSFDVRQRETLIYKAIFENYFKAQTITATLGSPDARTEGGDVLVANPNLLCIGQGIRTNRLGIEYLANYFSGNRGRFNIIIQELPFEPESFIHLDMVFTFLGSHQCMAFEPMLTKKGIFSNMATTLVTIDNGNINYQSVDNILQALRMLGHDISPVLCGGSDPWEQMREQWHSGSNFFALGDGKIIGYERNYKTIEALNKAGFSVLDAADVCAGNVDMNGYEKFVVTFKGSELPRGGGGARCMTMPIRRDSVEV